MPRRADHWLLARRNRWRRPRRTSGRHRTIVLGSVQHHLPNTRDERLTAVISSRSGEVLVRIGEDGEDMSSPRSSRQARGQAGRRGRYDHHANDATGGRAALADVRPRVEPELRRRPDRRAVVGPLRPDWGPGRCSASPVRLDGAKPGRRRGQGSARRLPGRSPVRLYECPLAPLYPEAGEDSDDVEDNPR